MSEANGAPPSPQQRRKSFVEMLNPRAFSASSSLSTSPSNPAPNSATIPGNRKSMSLALGLSGSGSGQDSAYNAFARQRRASISTSPASGSPEFRNSFDESAVIEDDDKMGPLNSPPSPSFARRLSFGAQAMRDVRQGGTSPSSNAGRRPSSSLFTLNEDADSSRVSPTSTSLPASQARASGTAKAGGEGFNWTDSMRDRTKRGSISSSNAFGSPNRTKSFTSPAAEPPKEMPQAPPPPPAAAPVKIKKPDHLGERMLRGDFMMD